MPERGKIPLTCLCLIRRDGAGGPELLIGLKKAGFGAGKWVGIGGKVEPGEQPEAAAVREVAEETGLLVRAAALRHAASIEFRFPYRPSWDQDAEVYVTRDYSGEPAESAELAPRWFAENALPLSLMWDDARYWLPLVLAGEHVTARFTFAADCATVASLAPDPLTGRR